MPEITISMAAGRTEEQKAGMMRDITKALVTNLGVDADAVVIQINEAPLHHKMKGGKTFVERAAARRSKLRCRPRLARNCARGAGTHNHRQLCLATLGPQPRIPLASVVMGPGSRSLPPSLFELRRTRRSLVRDDIV